MAEPWSDRRKRLEDVGAELVVPNVTIVPVTDDAAQLTAAHPIGRACARPTGSR